MSSIQPDSLVIHDKIRPQQSFSHSDRALNVKPQLPSLPCIRLPVPARSKAKKRRRSASATSSRSASSQPSSSAGILARSPSPLSLVDPDNLPGLEDAFPADDNLGFPGLPGLPDECE